MFLEALKLLFCDYGGKAPSEMMMQQRHQIIPSDIARLKGKRLVITSEIEENKRLNEARIKDLTGGDTIIARRLYGDWFEFEPTHKLWIYGNHKPVIRGMDAGETIAQEGVVDHLGIDLVIRNACLGVEAGPIVVDDDVVCYNG